MKNFENLFCYLLMLQSCSDVAPVPRVVALEYGHVVHTALLPGVALYVPLAQGSHNLVSVT